MQEKYTAIKISFSGISFISKSVFGLSKILPCLTYRSESTTHQEDKTLILCDKRMVKNKSWGSSRVKIMKIILQNKGTKIT
ncbi:hypothetical protein [Colwellia sp. MB3u-4]|uniref:hypothetical protein n=1 Tax=Colwellia sp. MB3u-4 TaxID=2759822 RepID=UPI0015F41F57|nr:hypothetical protein [Colwellia sp. MB3u-4]MBA6290241.1 hypothetical protein [Colwellia sp. MB3u-4]